MTPHAASVRPAQRLPLYTLYAANVISTSGNVMAFIAIPWFVLQTTGSASQTGITAAASALPTVIAAFLGGVIIDRIGYKRTSVLADLASGAAIALIPLLYATVGLAFWQLLALVFVGNLLDAPGATARLALSPDLAELAGMPLERAAALNDAVGRSARLIGAPIAGVLIAIVGATGVLWIDAATFLVSAMLIVGVVPRLAHVRPAETAASGSWFDRYLSDLRDGLRFIRQDRVILTIIGIVMITNFLDVAMGAVIMPVYVSRAFGDPVVLGLLSGVFGATAFLSAAFVGARGIHWSRRVTFSTAFMIVGTRFWIIALSPGLPVLLALHAVIGLAAGCLNPILSAVEFARIPAPMRARVFGVMTAGVLLGTPLAGLSGPLTDRIGLTVTLILLGTCYLITTGSLWFNAAIRQLDDEEAKGKGRLLAEPTAD